MLIPVIELCYDGSTYSLKEIYVNPRKIIYMHAVSPKKQLSEGLSGLDLHPLTPLTEIKISMDNHVKEIIVVGTPRNVEEKFFKIKKLLRG